MAGCGLVWLVDGLLGWRAEWLGLGGLVAGWAAWLPAGLVAWPAWLVKLKPGKISDVNVFMLGSERPGSNLVLQSELKDFWMVSLPSKNTSKRIKRFLDGKLTIQK